MKTESIFRLNQLGLVRMLVAVALLNFFVSLSRGIFTIPVTTGVPGAPSALLLQTWAWLGAAGSILFLLGSFERLSALVCLVCLNVSLLSIPVIAELHYPFLSLLLGIYAIFGSRAWGDWRPTGPRDEVVERELWYRPLFFSVFLGFTFMGAHKLFYPLWWNGDAIRLLCPRGPLGAAWPAVCGWLPNQWLGFAVMFIEVGSFPLALHPRTRPWIWVLNVILQLGILQFMFLRQISYVTLVMLLFLLDLRWFQQSARPKSSVTLSSK